MLPDRLAHVEERIQKAADRAGRKREEITLVAVTKKFPAEITMEAYQLGLRCFGENYVQEFERKHSALSGMAGAEFHLIGHLQSNKARIAGELFQAIETIDSEKLARRLDQLNRPLEVMIEAMKAHYDGGRLDAAASIAKDAAPFMHAKLAKT